MDITTKYKMVAEIINSNDENLLSSIKFLLKIEKKDFWNELSNNDKAAINKGLEQLDKGESVSHKEVQKNIKSQFYF